MPSPRIAESTQAGNDKDWDSSAVLDSMMKSLTTSTVPEVVPVVAVAPVSVAAAVKPAPAPAAEVEEEDEDTREETAELNKALSVSHQDAAPVGMLKVDMSSDGDADGKLVAPKVIFKKAVAAPRKPAVAKKLTATKKLGGGNDVAIESFEATEKRIAVAARREEEKAAHTASTPASRAIEEPTSRVNAAYSEVSAEVDSKPSIYRSTSAATSGKPPSKGGVATPSAAGESHEARDKYGKAKGISSDQFFGSGDDGDGHAKERLERFAGSTGIGSDMLGGGVSPSGPWAGSSAGQSAGGNVGSEIAALGRWTSDLMRRIG